MHPLIAATLYQQKDHRLNLETLIVFETAVRACSSIEMVQPIIVLKLTWIISVEVCHRGSNFGRSMLAMLFLLQTILLR